MVGHLNGGTFTLPDVVRKNGGMSPFGNDGVRYLGSGNDAALSTPIDQI